MNTTSSGRSLIQASVLFSAVALAAQLSAQTIPHGLHFPDTSEQENYVSFSFGYADLDSGSDNGSFQRMTQINAGGFGGIEALHNVQYLSNDAVFTIDAKAMLGDNDYRLVLRYDMPNGVYVEAGYKRARVFYNGNGGYFPPNGAFFEPSDSSLSLDRGELWLEGGLVQDKLTAKVRISHTFRSGQKDSTAWADSNLTDGNGSRYIVPSFWDIDETRDAIAADVEIRGDQLKYGGGLRYENIDIDDRRQIHRRPGESAERYVTQKDKNSSDLFSMHAFAESRPNDKSVFTGAVAYTRIDTNLGGSRIIGASYDPVFDPNFPRQSHDEGFLDLTGDANWHQTLITGNWLYLPAKGWRMQAGARYENQKQDLISEFVETNFGSGGGTADELEGASDRDWNDLLGTFGVTYSGIPNWVIDGKVELASGSGNLMEDIVEVETATADIMRDTDFDRDSSKLGVSARWYPSSMMNFAVGVYNKVRKNTYNTLQDSTPATGGDRFPAFITWQRFTTDDFYFRTGIRPGNGVSIVGRYDLQKTKTRSREEGLDSALSSELTTHIFSGSVSWTPIDRLVIQGGINYVYDFVETGLTGNVAQIAGKFDNNYVTENLLVLVMIDDRSDVQGDYYRYHAGNFRDISFISQPFGTTLTNESFGVTYTRRVSDTMNFSVRYAYAKLDDLTSGGHNDYNANILYGRVQLRY